MTKKIEKQNKDKNVGKKADTKKEENKKEYHEGLEIIAKEIQIVNGVKYRKLILINGTSVLL